MAVVRCLHSTCWWRRKKKILQREHNIPVCQGVCSNSHSFTGLSLCLRVYGSESETPKGTQKQKKKEDLPVINKQFCLAYCDSLGEMVEQMHLIVHTIHRVFGWSLLWGGGHFAV